MLSLVVYVPTSHLDAVKAALFAAGAGKIGNYDSCCWQTKGTGQFRALEGSDPFIGKQGAVEQVEEWKLELVCERRLAPAILAALKNAHPYETPAYHFVEILHN
jgi:hypothetical protein